MKLDTLTRGQCQLVREWRNAEPQFLRTPYMITEKMQDDFFDNVINDRDSKHRYFAIIEDVKETIQTSDTHFEERMNTFIGMGGLTNIEWENGTAEISLIINPDYRRQGKGAKAVDLMLIQAFNIMRLLSVYGEVYRCGNVAFWESIVKEYEPDSYRTDLPNRKYFNGVMFPSVWFSIARNENIIPYKIEDIK